MLPFLYELFQSKQIVKSSLLKNSNLLKMPVNAKITKSTFATLNEIMDLGNGVINGC